VARAPRVVFGRVPPWALRGLVLPLGLLLLAHACALDTIRVSGSSMEKTLEPGDFLLVSKLGVTRAALTGAPYLPRRGEVVVFRLPQNHSLVLIKRVVALPGEALTLPDGSVHVVGEGCVFVEGDNRAPGASSDSRDWGDLPAREIVGTAVLRVLPLRTAGPLS
jgi:signal peptidase I